MAKTDIDYDDVPGKGEEAEMGAALSVAGIRESAELEKDFLLSKMLTLAMEGEGSELQHLAEGYLASELAIILTKSEVFLPLLAKKGDTAKRIDRMAKAFFSRGEH
jgi:hypothetical protein